MIIKSGMISKLEYSIVAREIILRDSEKLKFLVRLV